MVIKEKESTNMSLNAWCTLSVVATEKTLIYNLVSGEISGEVLTVTPSFPVTVGPLTKNSNWVIESISGIATVTSEAVGQICRVEKTVDADLPTFGKTGLIYETESGWLRWDELTGEYVNTSGAPLKPVAVPGETPVISGETAIGSTLTVTSPGGWTGRPSSYTYQWSLDGSELVGETEISYTTVESCAGLDVTCNIVGVNIIGAATTGEDSNAITIDSE